jgi:hypothetical protein
MKESRSNKIKSLQREILTSEYRSIPRNLRAIKLVYENKCNKQLAAESCSTTARTINRADKAIRSGREVGKVGNPRIFNEQEEFELYELLRNVSKEKNMTNDMLREEVREIMIGQ